MAEDAVLVHIRPRHRAAVLAAGLLGGAKQQLAAAIAQGDAGVELAKGVLEVHGSLANQPIDEGGGRPLHAAAAVHGGTEMCKLLLAHQADPAAVTNTEATALHILLIMAMSLQCSCCLACLARMRISTHPTLRDKLRYS